MTMLDRDQPHAGYWPSPWPVECGGNRRQKTATGRLDAATHTASVTTVRNDRWNVMVVAREPGEWYLGGTMAAFTGDPPFGWVQRIDPDSLEPRATSPELPCGEHVWCGAILAHANGSIHSVNGSYLHRLDPHDLSVQAERRLPVDRSHNGLLALSDGTLITKDLRLEGQGGTTITRLDPDTLELVGDPLVLPEGSMGRIAADALDEAGAEAGGAASDATDAVYVPGSEHVWRILAPPSGLTVDDWRPRYRGPADAWGLAWDVCLSAGECWLHDCGDVPSVRHIHSVEPNGRYPEPPGRALSWRNPAPWSGAQRLLRVPLDGDSTAGDVRFAEPFGRPGGGVIAPPMHVPEHEMAIAWDSINGGLAGVSTAGGGLEPAWHVEARPSMQPVYFAGSAELVINDFTDAGSDDLIVVDVRSGEVLDRVATGSRIANGMFLTPGADRDVYYCTTAYLARVQWS